MHVLHSFTMYILCVLLLAFSNLMLVHNTNCHGCTITLLAASNDLLTVCHSSMECTKSHMYIHLASYSIVFTDSDFHDVTSTNG